MKNSAGLLNVFFRRVHSQGDDFSTSTNTYNDIHFVLKLIYSQCKKYATLLLFNKLWKNRRFIMAF